MKTQSKVLAATFFDTTQHGCGRQDSEKSLFYVDVETKAVTTVPVNMISPPVVFCISFRTLDDDKGDSRDPLNTANLIARSLSINPVFLNGDDQDKVQNFLASHPNSLLVGINLKFLDADFQNAHSNFLSVGANYWSSYSQAPMCNIVLNPSFDFMEEHWDYDKYAPFAPEDQLKIGYTCVPSRMERKPPFDTERENKTVIVYIRSPWDYPFNHEDSLLETMKVLREKHGCCFLVSTGPSGPERARKIQAYVHSLPDSEFYDFSENGGEDNPWTDFLRQADIGIVTDDTISSTCDMIHTGIPVLLHTNPEKAYSLTRLGDDKYSLSKAANTANYRFQKSLIEHGRLKILDTDSLESAWQQPAYDEWQKIGDRIAHVISNKCRQLNQDCSKQSLLIQNRHAGFEF